MGSLLSICDIYKEVQAKNVFSEENKRRIFFNEPKYEELKLTFQFNDRIGVDLNQVYTLSPNPIFGYLPLEIIKTVLLNSNIDSVEEINEEIRALSTLSGYKAKSKKNKGSNQTG